MADEESSMSLPGEEQNCSLREEIVHLDQLLVSSQAEADEVTCKYQELAEQMENILKEQSHDSDLEEDLMEDAGQHPKEFKSHMEEEMNKYKNRLFSCQSLHQEESKIIDNIYTRIEEYRSRCARLEVAFLDYAEDNTKDVSDYCEETGNQLNVETLKLKLEQEKLKCQRLSQINTFCRNQLEIATETNKAMTADIHRLSNEWKITRNELNEKEELWRKEEQSLTIYLTKEHHRLLSLWNRVRYCRGQFSKMKNATEKDLFFLKSQVKTICQHVHDSCIQLTLSSPVSEVSESKDALQLQKEISDLKQAYEIEKDELSKRIENLSLTMEKKQMIIEEKDRNINTLNNTIESMVQANQKLPSEGQLLENPVSRCCKALKDIGQSVVDDSEHPTWNGSLRGSSLSNIRNALLTSTPHSYHNICDDPQFLESTVVSVQSTLRKRCFQVEELKMKLRTLDEKIETLQKTNDDLEEEKQNLHQLTSRLSVQFDNVQSNMQEYLKDKGQLSVSEKEMQKYYLEQKVFNKQIEKLNSENEQLFQMQKQLYQRIQQTKSEKDKLVLSEQSLTMDLNRSAKKVLLLEQQLEEVEKQHQEVQRKLEKVGMDNELLIQEKEETVSNLNKIELHRVELDADVLSLKKDADTLNASMLSLQSLNEALIQDKQELQQSLEEATGEIESLKASHLKVKSEYDTAKQEHKKKYEEVHDMNLELKGQIEILKSNYAKLDKLKSEYEDSQQIIVQRNNDLINQVTKLSNQKDILERELQQTRAEILTRFEEENKLAEERENLARRRAELTVDSEASETELNRLHDLIDALREEKEQFQKGLYSSQQLVNNLNEEKQSWENEMEQAESRIEQLQTQLSELKHQYEMHLESSARQKDSLNQKIEQMEIEYSTTSRSVQLEHKKQLDQLILEKDSQRVRLETSLDQLSRQSQTEMEDVLHKHSQEVLLFQKKSALNSKQIEDTICNIVSNNSASEKKLEDEKQVLEQTVESLLRKIELLNSENVEVDSSKSNDDYQFLLDEKEKEIAKLKEEIQSVYSRRESFIKNMESELEELKLMKESALEEVTQITCQLNTLQIENKSLERKIEEISGSAEDAHRSNDHTEQEILVLEQKLRNEKKQVELGKMAQDDLKQRLYSLQSENNELKFTLNTLKQRVQSLEATDAQSVDQCKELNDTLREVEASRMDSRRESQHLRRRLVISEASLQSKGRELNEMQLVISKADDAETELKTTISKLKQKVMEAEASKEATYKELSNLQKKAWTMEQKLKLKQEEHNASLQEALTGELSHTDQRVSFERLLADSVEEARDLRLKLKYAEGKVTALEKQISKLKDAKQEVEGKLQSIQLSLRSFLGLGTDSGFQGSNTQLLISPFSSQRISPLGSHQNVHESGVFRPTISTPIRAESSVIDLDPEFIRNALQDFVQKSFNTEKDRDDLCMRLNQMQRELNEAKEEHELHLQKFKRMQKELEAVSKDKKDLENQLSVTRSAITHMENMVQSLESEKRQLFEQNANLLSSVTASEVEINNFQSKVAELRQNEASLRQEKMILKEYRDAAEANAIKTELLTQEMQAEKATVTEILKIRVSEVEVLQKNVDELKRLLGSSKNKHRSLQTTADHLNSVVDRYKSNETILLEKLQSLESSLSEATLATQQLNKDLLLLKREHGSCEHEKSFFRSETDAQRGLITELRNRNNTLKGQVGELTTKSKELDLQKAELEGHILGYKNVMSMSGDSELTTNDQIRSLMREKLLLEEELTRLKIDFSQTEKLRTQSEKQKNKYDKENALLRKALEKAKKERYETQELVSLSVLEREALGKSLTKVEFENQQLMGKVQNLQVQLVEVEERHMNRVKELDKKKKFEMQLELERQKSTQKHLELMLNAKEKTHRHKVSGLEQQVALLQDHLHQAHSTTKLRSTARSASASFLNDIFKDGKTSDNEELAKHLSSSQGSSPNILVISSSPSSESHSPLPRATSTPQVRRRIDKNFPS